MKMIVSMIAIVLGVAFAGGATPHQARAVAPLTSVGLSVSPNPNGFSDYVSFHWVATGFPDPSAVTCSDNKGWLVNAPYTGTVYKYAGVDFTASFTWTVSCADDNFYGSYSVAVTYYPAAAEFTSDIQTETLDAYDLHNPDCAAGRRHTRHAKVKYWQPFHLYTYWTYYEQVRWCWNAAHTKVSYFRRDRWTGGTNVGWTFDGHIYTNCGPYDPEHCSGMIGSYSESATTQGHYHVIVRGMGFDKYPWITIWVHADGGSGADWHL